MAVALPEAAASTHVYSSAVPEHQFVTHRPWLGKPQRSALASVLHDASIFGQPPGGKTLCDLIYNLGIYFCGVSKLG